MKNSILFLCLLGIVSSLRAQTYSAGAGAGTGGTTNVHVGTNAGNASTGNWNTVVGSAAGQSTTASGSVMVGAGAGQTTSSNSSVLVGTSAGSAMVGGSNIAIGASAGQSAAISSGVMIGTNAGKNFSGGSGFQIFIGGNTGQNASGFGNTFIGQEAGYSSNGSENIFIGLSAGKYNNPLSTALMGRQNIFLGSNAGLVNESSGNIYIGWEAAKGSTSGASNTMIGLQAGFSNTSGSNNAFFGYKAGMANAGGMNNTFIGNSAGSSNTSSYNTFVGNVAGQGVTTGSFNTIVGSNSGVGLITGSNNTIIGRVYGIGSALSNSIIIADGSGNQRLFVSSAGNAGFGTVTPQNRLDVEGAAAIGATYSGTNTAPANGLAVEGRVGIGLVNPANKLQITHGLEGNSGLRFTNLKATSATGGTATKFLTLNNDGDVIYRDLPGSSSGSTNVYAGTGINVTGTASSGYTVSAIAPTLSIGMDGELYITGGSHVPFPEVEDTSIYAGDGTISGDRKVNMSSKLLFNTSGGGKVYIGDKTAASSANVVSGYKLFVEDGIMTEKVKVALTGSAAWPDYVFGTGYELLSLKELEAYIAQHSHLPDVPSAADVRQNGLDLGTMQTTQMKKIEELTLYIIAQDKKLEDQTKQLEKQAKDLQALKDQMAVLSGKNK